MAPEQAKEKKENQQNKKEFNAYFTRNIGKVPAK